MMLKNLSRIKKTGSAFYSKNSTILVHGPCLVLELSFIHLNGDELQYQIQSVALFWKKKKKSRSIFPNLEKPPLNQVVNL